MLIWFRLIYICRYFRLVGLFLADVFFMSAACELRQCVRNTIGLNKTFIDWVPTHDSNACMHANGYKL